MFICNNCGRDNFKSRQALISHQKVCKQTQENRIEDHRLEELSQEIGLLKVEVNDLKHQVRKLVEFHTVPMGVSMSGYHKNYFIPEGFRISPEENPLAALRARMTDMEKQLNSFKLEMINNYQTFERELKGWVSNVLP